MSKASLNVPRLKILLLVVDLKYLLPPLIDGKESTAVSAGLLKHFRVSVDVELATPVFGTWGIGANPKAHFSVLNHKIVNLFKNIRKNTLFLLNY